MSEAEGKSHTLILSTEEVIFLKECIAVSWKTRFINDSKVGRKINVLEDKLELLVPTKEG